MALSISIKHCCYFENSWHEFRFLGNWQFWNGRVCNWNFNLNERIMVECDNIPHNFHRKNTPKNIKHCFFFVERLFLNRFLIKMCNFFQKGRKKSFQCNGPLKVLELPAIRIELRWSDCVQKHALCGQVSVHLQRWHLTLIDCTLALSLHTYLYNIGWICKLNGVRRKISLDVGVVPYP